MSMLIKTYTIIRDYASIIQTKVMAPESFQFRHSFSDPILNDSLACANLDIVGGHIYGGGIAPYPLAESKGKEIWMTEHYTDSQNLGNLLPMALDVGTEIHNVMNAGMNAYVWWYIVRYYGPISDGNNNSGQKGEVTKRGYIMSQYSRFIRPGYVRVSATESPRAGIYITAYKGDSKVIIVVVNKRSSAIEQTFWIQNLPGGIAVFTPYVTSETKNCIQESDIEVSNGSFTTSLDGESVTTFVADNISSVGDHIMVPQMIMLSQNYPNPFNPSTPIFIN